MMEEVSHYPNMNTWAPLRRNILTEDDHHINIPYFGDEVGPDHCFLTFMSCDFR